MEFVGEYLKSIRISKNCTIEELSNELKISQHLIKKIELDDFSDNFRDVFVMGYIRSYSNFFDLASDDLIETFKTQVSYNKLDTSKRIPKPLKTTNLLSMTKTFYFASISIISLSFYFIFINPDNFEKEYVMTPDLPENLEYIIEEVQMNLSLLQEKNKKLKSFSSINEEIIKGFEVGVYSPNSSSASASNSKDFSLKDSDDEITLRFLNPTWIQLRDIDDNIIISKLMNEGDEYSYNLLENLNLTAGNAGNIIVSLNGIVKGKMGRAGDVIESFTIDKNFNN